MRYFLQIAVSIVVVLGALGWIMNFWNLFQYEFPAQEFIISVIGIFFPPWVQSQDFCTERRAVS
mgnify:CR=1 FL=1